MDKVYKYVQANVPEATIEDIDTIYAKHNGDLLETISELMKIPAKVEKQKTDWEKRRDICDEYDTEMYKRMRSKST